MILRAAIIVLLALNLGVAAWWLVGGGAAPQRTAAADSPVAPRLRLVSEVAVTPPPAAQSAPVVAPAAPEVASAAPKAEEARCLRFGPYADAATRDAARPLLAADTDALLPRETPASTGRGWKVHIPPFASRDEAKAMGERIKSAGITDWYLLNEGADANGIALGRYRGEEAARRREAELTAKGIPARAEALGSGAPQWWLDARLKAGTDLAAVARIGASKRIDCAALR